MTLRPVINEMRPQRLVLQVVPKSNLFQETFKQVTSIYRKLGHLRIIYDEPKVNLSRKLNLNHANFYFNGSFMDPARDYSQEIVFI